jgi:hypothetical protein
VPEFTPGALNKILAGINQQGRAAARTGLTGLADALVKQAKSNASSGRHAYGTPTPARPGTGPAVISGTLRASIDRTAVTLNAAGWEAKVGLVPGRTPPYRKGRSATSSKYGLFLETGLRNGAKYPFLQPATRMAHIQADVAFKRAFESVQWRMG